MMPSTSHVEYLLTDLALLKLMKLDFLWIKEFGETCGVAFRKGLWKKYAKTARIHVVELKRHGHGLSHDHTVSLSICSPNDAATFLLLFWA